MADQPETPGKPGITGKGDRGGGTGNPAHRVGRRALLAGAAGAVLALPLAPRLASTARAQATGMGPATGVGQAEGPAAYLARFQAYQVIDPARADHFGPVEEAVAAETNRRRGEAGVQPLETDPTLGWIARFYGHILSTTDLFDHADEQGRSPDQRIGILHRRHAGPTGENLFRTDILLLTRPGDMGAFAVDSLMDSPGHRANILEPHWTHGGMGVVSDGATVTVVQLFARRDLLLAEDLPITVAAGSALPQAGRFDTGSAERVGLVPLGQAPSLADLAPPGRARAPARAGVQRLQAALRTGTEGRSISYELVPGPIVEVVAG